MALLWPTSLLPLLIFCKAFNATCALANIKIISKTNYEYKGNFKIIIFNKKDNYSSVPAGMQIKIVLSLFGLAQDLVVNSSKIFVRKFFLI